MALDKFEEPVERSVWENKNGSRVTTASGLLKTGEYEVSRQVKDNGTIILKYTPKDDSG